MNLSSLGRCLFVIACLGSGVCSSKLSNKHLRVVVVPWKPFFGWKCPNHKGYNDWWSRGVNGASESEDEVYYAKTSGTSGADLLAR